MIEKNIKNLVLNKMPTGIKTFDVNINDGFPAGSVILLLEDIGAGAREFIYTSIFNIDQLKSGDNITFANKYKGKSFDDINEMPAVPMLPGKICYISVSKSLEDILKENAYAFRKDFYKSLQQVVFKDLSDIYFCHSRVHNLWGGRLDNDCDKNNDKNILKEISEFLAKNAENNVVVIDSLTDLMLYDGNQLNKNDIVMFLKGMAKISKVWNGLIYIILSANILDDQMQEIIKDIVDGVLVFEWFDKGSDKMRRNLYLSKFRGLIPRIEQNKISKFETKVTYDNGFEVSNVRKII